MTPPSCSLYAITARDLRSVLLFRRGPTRRAALLRWWLDDDRIEEGQWLKGFLYGRQSDLSADGNYLLYFAADQRAGFGSWTAISHPPFLTALALWPKGDLWGGGGLFQGKRRVALDHSAQQMALAPSFRLPRGWQAKQWKRPRLHDAVTGKTLPPNIELARLARDGWQLRSLAASEAPSGGLLRLSRRSPADPQLMLSLVGARADLANADGHLLRRIDGVSWSDFSREGDLLLTSGGCLYRIAARRLASASADPLADARLIGDLRALTFRELAPTPQAKRW